jgi:uncharacterized membrane protein YfcA
LIEIRVAALISLGLICGLIFGAQFALAMPADILERAYGFFLIYVGWRFIEPRKLYASIPQPAPAPPKRHPPTPGCPGSSCSAWGWWPDWPAACSGSAADW